MIKLERTQQLADIIHGTIIYSGLEGAILSSRIFNRLHHISQGSLVALTYSSNNIKRFEHSIGVMYLAGEIFYHSLNNSTDSEAKKQLVAETKSAFEKWFRSINWLDPGKSLDRSFYQQFKDKEYEIPYPKCNLYYDKLIKPLDSSEMSDPFERLGYITLFQAIRIAGLLHDIGHLPYSHIFEHATKKLFHQVKALSKRNNAQKEFLEIFNNFYTDIDSPKELHEEIGIALLTQLKSDILDELPSSNVDNLFVHAVFWFADKILRAKKEENSFFADIHRIIAGTFDADRLDYCCRDAFCSGANKNIFPYDRLIPNYKIVLANISRLDDDPRKNIVFCPALKNLLEVEDLLERRWEVFTKINYHHRVHKHEAIFAEILSKIGLKELEKCKKIESLEPKQPLPLKLLSIWDLVRKLKENNAPIAYLVIQLDDGWMDTFLKNAYFTYSFDADGSPEWYKLDELISVKKHYFTLFKRSVDFIDFDIELGKQLLQKYDKKENKENTYLSEVLTNVKNNLKEQIKSHFNALNINYMVSHLINSKKNNPNIYDLFLQDIENEINSFLEVYEGQDLNIVNCMVCSCKPTLGFDEYCPILLWKDASFRNFHSVSKERDLLLSKSSVNLPFHIYYLPRKNATSNKDVFQNKILEGIIDVYEKYVE